MILYTNENKLFMNFVDNGDIDSFDELFNQTSPWLYKCIYRIVANTQVAEDILQDSWAIMIEHKSTFNPQKGSFGNLIFTIAKNLAFKEVTKNKNGLMINNSNIINSSLSKEISPDEAMNLNQRKMVLHKAIYKLKQDYQDVILMYYYGDLSIKEIAENLDIPENTVKTKLSRAKTTIEGFLKNESQFDLLSLLTL